MKRMMAVLAAMLMIFGVCRAEEKVYVSVSNAAGDVVLAYAEIDVHDTDADGAVTIHDALMCAHVQKHEKGAAAYLAEKTEYGMSLVCLWDEENGGSFGYYLNHASAWSLLDPVKSGDHVKAYAFTDLETWSDVYCYFDKDAVQVNAGEEIALALYAATFDEAWNPIAIPASGARIMIDGAESAYVTDENGCVTLKFESAGEHLISAKSDALVLVPPVCAAVITEGK